MLGEAVDEVKLSMIEAIKRVGRLAEETRVNDKGETVNELGQVVDDSYLEEDELLERIQDMQMAMQGVSKSVITLENTYDKIKRKHWELEMQLPVAEEYLQVVTVFWLT